MSNQWISHPFSWDTKDFLVFVLCLFASAPADSGEKISLSSIIVSFLSAGSEYIKRITSRSSKLVKQLHSHYDFQTGRACGSILNPSTTVGVLIVFLSFLLPPRRRKEPNEPWSPKHQATVTFRDSWKEFFYALLCDFVVPHGDPIFVNHFFGVCKAQATSTMEGNQVKYPRLWAHFLTYFDEKYVFWLLDIASSFTSLFLKRNLALACTTKISPLIFIFTS